MLAEQWEILKENTPAPSSKSTASTTTRRSQSSFFHTLVGRTPPPLLSPGSYCQKPEPQERRGVRALKPPPGRSAPETSCPPSEAGGRVKRREQALQTSTSVPPRHDLHPRRRLTQARQRSYVKRPTERAGAPYFPFRTY